MQILSLEEVDFLLDNFFYFFFSLTNQQAQYVRGPLFKMEPSKLTTLLLVSHLIVGTHQLYCLPEIHLSPFHPDSM